MNELKFNIFKTDYYQVQILIDGEDLVDAVNRATTINGYQNIPPNTLLELLLREGWAFENYANLPEDDELETIIYSCDCGWIDCDFTTVEIDVTNDKVTWKNFESRVERFSKIGPFEFTRKNYDECLGVLTQYVENKKK